MPGYKPTLQGHPAQIKKAAKLINEATETAYYCRQGCYHLRAYAELKELAETAQIPVITTLLGIGCFPESHVSKLRHAGNARHGLC